MARKTLLSIVQNVLTSINDDAVSSIDESPEAEDLANLAKSVFEEVSNWDEWPSTFKMADLSPVSDNNAPTVFLINDDYRFIEYLQYMVEKNSKTYFKNLEYVTPDRFLEYSDQSLSDEAIVKSTGYGVDGTFVVVRTDSEPSYYTSFDNKHVILNSFDYSKERNVQASKVRARVCALPEFRIEDDFVLDYPQELMTLYMAELRVAASFYFNQEDNVRDRRLSLRMLNKLRSPSKNRVVNEQQENWPNGIYARHGTAAPNIRKLGRR